MNIIGCIPVKALPEAPKDQSPCTQEKCPICNEAMWVSEKKKELRKNTGMKTCCFGCIAQMMME